ncbi:MAG: YbhN family protein [Acidimicrobiia bacterium]|nr:YbhN family protein [Acidimicrobiia bacterium]
MADSSASTWRTIALRSVMLLLGGIALYLLSPVLLDVVSSAPRLEAISWWWFVIMAALETASFAAAWALARVAVPGLGWGVAATAQLASNASSRVFPGAAVVGGAVYYRMLAGAGVQASRAAAALTVNSIISNLLLFALPAVAAAVAVVSAPIPAGLLPIALGGLGLFAALLAVGVLIVRYDAPLRGFMSFVKRLVGAIPGIRRVARRIHPEGVLRVRDEIVAAVGPRWQAATFYAASNWLLDYLVLVAALYGVGARPRLSIVLLAYGAAAVLTMIPITPGGFGFVEAGLATMLIVAGVPSSSALLATLAYRLFSFWLPIPAGGIAYLVYKRRYLGEETLPEEAEVEVSGLAADTDETSGSRGGDSNP